MHLWFCLVIYHHQDPDKDPSSVMTSRLKTKAGRAFAIAARMSLSYNIYAPVIYVLWAEFTYSRVCLAKYV